MKIDEEVATTTPNTIGTGERLDRARRPRSPSAAWRAATATEVKMQRAISLVDAQVDQLAQRHRLVLCAGSRACGRRPPPCR